MTTNPTISVALNPWCSGTNGRVNAWRENCFVDKNIELILIILIRIIINFKKRKKLRSINNLPHYLKEPWES